MAGFGQGTPGLDIPLTAEADLSSSQFCVVALGTAAGTVKVCTTTDKPFGVLQNTPTAGQEASIRVAGTSAVKADGTYSKDADLMVTDANGEVNTATALDADYLTETSVWVVGRAMEAATAAGDLMEMLITLFERTS